MIEDLKKVLDLRGLMLNVLEVGCGCPIAEAFMSQDGASNYIFSSMAPYSKEAQEDFLEAKFPYRSVSGQFVYDACQKLDILRAGLTKENETIDIVISMQVGHDRDNHGWICLDRTHIYHFTLGYNKQRSFARNAIIAIIEDLIIYHYGDMAFIEPRSGMYIDGYFYCEGRFDGESIFNLVHLPVNHAPFAVIDGKWMRLTEAIRDWKVLNIVKGSFNPYHEAHQELMEAFPGRSILSITTKTTVEGKEAISILEAFNRVKAAKQPAIIDSSWTYYSDLIAGLNYFTDIDAKSIHFSMGVDTFARFDPIPGIQNHVFARNIMIPGTTFYVSKYPDVSSTKIRDNENSPTSNT